MEGFLAALSLYPETVDLEQIAKVIKKAVTGCYSSGEHNICTYTDKNLVFTHAKANLASDALQQTFSGGGLIYIFGPITVLDFLKTDNQFQNDPQSDNQTDRLISTFQTAIHSYFSHGFGLECLSGSFHALLHEPTHNRTFVLLDCLGSRPVFSFFAENILFLSSDIRLLLALPYIDSTLDLEGIAQFIRYQMILEDRTLYRSIKMLPPASLLEIDYKSHSYESNQYWRLSRMSTYQTKQEAIEATATTFRLATGRLIDSNDKTAILLSGGIDSRMILASMSDVEKNEIEACSFEFGESDESLIAKQLANIAGINWTLVKQDTDIYWDNMQKALDVSNGLYSLGHTHTFYPASILALKGFDTVFDGWGLDLLFSGSYLPQKHSKIVGRKLYSFQLGKLDTPQDVFNYLHELLDIQEDDFKLSILHESQYELWKIAPREALTRLVNRAIEQSEVPYDWIDYVLFGFGIAKFRSYPMVAGVSAQLRERNPLFERDLLEVYQRLPYHWRFLGLIYRLALLQLSPSLAMIIYSNTGTNPLASPFIQALSTQANAFWRANRSRIGKLIDHTGIKLPHTRAHGSYPDATILAAFILSNHHLAAKRAISLLNEGFLTGSGLINPKSLNNMIEICQNGNWNASMTLLTLATLALWLNSYPARMP